MVVVLVVRQIAAREVGPELEMNDSKISNENIDMNHHMLACPQ